MAPEQRAALAAVSEGRPVPAPVDGRSDVYGLGLVLYQALGGPVPPSSPPPRLDQCNRRVSAGLADILARCLADDPAERYPDAAALADDLRRHLTNLPLRGVPNRSLGERWRKWRRRRPHAVTALWLLALLLGGVAWGVIHQVEGAQAERRERQARAEEAHAEGQALLGKEQYALAAARFQRGLALVPAEDELARRLHEQLALAHRREIDDQLHRLADSLRVASLAEDLTENDLRELTRSCSRLWEARDWLAALSPRARTDLLDVAVIWVDTRRRLEGGSRAGEWGQEALRVLDEAEQSFGPNAVLSWERAALARELGVPEPKGARAVPRSAREHYALGRRLLREGQLERAADHLERAVACDPGGFWPHFYLGVCAFRLGQYAAAAGAFRAAIALAPQSAAAHHNRGLAHERLGQDQQALRDYSRALELDPSLAEAALNRALLYRRLVRSERAREDAELALRLRPDWAPARALLEQLPRR
jgi:tetratricopeptide (TPR) repeat protein